MTLLAPEVWEGRLFTGTWMPARTTRTSREPATHPIPVCTMG